MSFGDFLVQGSGFSNREYLRATYPSDRTELGESSFQYEGNVIPTTLDGSVRVIDRTITVISVPKKQREEAIATLSTMSTYSMLTGVGSTALTFVGFIPAVGVAILAFYRAADASSAAEAWRDPAPGLRDLRVRCSQNFIQLYNRKLSGKVYTKEETQNIYVKCFQNTHQKYFEAIRTGDPRYLENFIQKFFKRDNLLSRDLINYAFASDKYVQDPSPAKLGCWKKESFCAYSNEMQSLAQRYIAFEGKRRGQVQAVDNVADVGHTAIFGSQVVASDVFRRDEKRVAGNRQKAADDRWSNEMTSSVFGFVGHSVVDVCSASQKAAIERQAQEALLQNFGVPLGNILTCLDESKIKY